MSPSPPRVSRLRRRAVAGLVIAVTACVASWVAAVPAHAADEPHVSMWDQTLTVAEDGSVQVSLMLSYDYADSEEDGFDLDISTMQRVGDVQTRYFPVENFSVTTPESEPVTFRVSAFEDHSTFRIGEADAPFSGVHTYAISYHQKGVVTSGEDDIPRLSWNVVGFGWQVPITNVTVAVKGPGEAVTATCKVGTRPQVEPCPQAHPDARGMFRVDQVLPEQDLRIDAAFVKGSMPNAQPILTRPLNIVVPWINIAVAAAILIVGGGLYVGARRRYASEAYLSVPVGVLPPDPSTAPTGPLRQATLAPFHPRQIPPEGLLPGHCGFLNNHQVTPDDVTATLVDLAVQGHFAVDMHEPEDGLLTKTAVTPPSTEYENVLLSRLFGSRSTVRLSTLRDTFTDDAAAVVAALTADCTQRSWFVRDPHVAGRRWRRVGLVLVSISAISLVSIPWGLSLLADPADPLFVGVPEHALYLTCFLLPVLVLGWLGVRTLRTRVGGRSAYGTALKQQLDEFTAYLTGSDVPVPCDGDDPFSRFLPFAVALSGSASWAGRLDRSTLQREESQPLRWLRVSSPHPDFAASSPVQSNDPFDVFRSVAWATRYTPSTAASGTPRRAVDTRPSSPTDPDTLHHP